MQHHEKYSRTIRRSESGLRCGCAAVAAVLACVTPGYAAHNRVTVTMYGDAAGVTARAERLETIMECTPTEGHTALWNYAYDLAGRQTSVSLAVDGGSASTVATYTYDGVGRLASKSFGTVGNGTSVEYVYDARSNVTSVSGSGFAQTAYFGTNPVEGGASRYLSPCAASERQYGAEGEGVSQTMWTYRYDGFGRLAEASATDAVSAPDRALGEVFEYDRNSNILSLERVYAGEPVQLFGTKRVTDRAHIGNRWSNFAGLGWHDNTARWHDAILDRFTTPDPKAADYPSFSPYTHCAANPLRFTDPTGMDIYCFDDNGTLIKVIEDDGNDKVSIGTYEDGTYAAYYTEELNGNGVINPYYNTTYEADGVRYEIEAFKVRGDENAEKTFETLAEHTGKEWSLFQTGKSGEKGLNFLSTSHKGASDISGSYIFNRQLKFGYTIRAHHHNHPRGTAQESDADRTFRDIVRGVTRQNVLFYVYTTGTGAIDYTNNKK